MKKLSRALFVLFIAVLVWGAWIAMRQVVVWFLPDLIEYAVDVTFFDWMVDVLPGAGLLFAFSFVSFLCLSAAYRWVCKKKWVLRALLFPIPAVLFAGMLWATMVRFINYHEYKFYTYSGPPAEDSLGGDLMEKIAGMRKLIANAPWPGSADEINEKNLNGELFDVGSFFTVLTNLNEKAGYELDYVHVGSSDGFPILYPQKNGAIPYKTGREYIDSLPPGKWRPNGDYLQDWSPAIEMKSTPEAFLELSALHLVGNQFYLYWHANYNDRIIIASQEKLEEILNQEHRLLGLLPVGCRMKACELDVRPVVEFMEEEPVVWVDLLTFTKWGGFIQEKLAFSTVYPHKLLMRESETLIEYLCGICY